MSTCATCRHMHTVDGTHFCRRYPPTVAIFLREGRHPLTGVPSIQQNTVSAYPAIQIDARCGEYTPPVLAMQ